jgi:hypothetical protein
MKKADIFEFYRRLAEANPAPETEFGAVNGCGGKQGDARAVCRG